jgi:hypothetical protein
MELFPQIGHLSKNGGSRSLMIKEPFTEDLPIELALQNEKEFPGTEGKMRKDLSRQKGKNMQSQEVMRGPGMAGIQENIQCALD